MSRDLRLCLAVSLLFTALPLAAQDTQETQEPKERVGNVGIGVSLNPAALVAFDEELFFFPVGLNNFVVPIRAGQVIWEPEFGLFRTSFSSSGSGFSSSSSFRSLRLGIGLLLNMRERGGLHPYFGPRLGIMRISSESESGSSSSSTSQTNWSISGVMGAQHFFSQHFSLGGEVQLTRVSFGEQDREPPPPSASTESGSLIGTAALLLLRWYF